MADTGDNLGDLTVNVTGDFSELQSAIDQSVTVAQSGSEAIASALQGVSDASGLAGRDLEIFQQIVQQDTDAGIALSQSLEDLSNSASQVGATIAGGAAAALEQLQAGEQSAGDAAEATTGSLNDEAGAISNVSEHAEEAETGLSAMAEGSFAIGEALALTEGLKEFIQESIDVYGETQNVITSLELLGSTAAEAEETISSLSDMSLNLAVPFEDLEQAARRLTVAFQGVEGIDINDILQTAADSAALTGKSFDQVTTALQRVEVTGAVTSRQLLQLGITWQQLAATADTSVAEVQAVLKKGGQDATQDLELVMQTINAMASGAAQAQAQTILGQITILKNQVELLFAAIGQDIAPFVATVVSGLSSVIQVVRDIATGFQELPQPVKDTAIALAAAATAVVPLTLGLGAVGIGLNAIAGIVPAYNALMAQLAAITGADAIAQEADAIATTEHGAAALAAAPEVEALAVAEGQSAIAAGAATTGLGTLEGAELASGAAAAEAGTAVEGLGIGIGAISGYAAIALVGIAGIISGARDAATEFGNLKGTISSIQSGITDLGGPTEALKDALFALGVNTNQLEGPLSEVTELTGQVTEKMVSFAEAAASGAWANFASLMTGQVGKALQFVDLGLTLIGTKLGLIKPQMQSFVDEEGAWTESSVGFGVAAQAVGSKIDKLEGSLQSAKQAIAEYKGALVNATPGTSDFQRYTDLLAASEVEATAAQKALNTALGETPAKLKPAQDSIQALGDAITKDSGTFDNANTTYANMLSAYQRGDTKLNGVALNANTITIAYNNLANAYLKATGQVLQWTATAPQVQQAAQTEINASTSLQNNLNYQLAAWQKLSNAGPQFAIAGSLAFEKVQSAAKALGIQVTETANGLQFTLADGSKIAAGAVQPLIDKLNTLYGVQVETVTVNGQAVRTFQSLAQTLGDGETAVGQFGQTANLSANGVLVLKGASDSAGQSFDATQTKIINFNGTLASLTGTVVDNSHTITDATNGVVQYTQSMQDAADGVDNFTVIENDLTQSATDATGATNAEADKLLDLAKAADDAADAVNNLNSANSKLKGGAGAGGAGGGQSGEEFGAYGLSFGQDPATSGFTSYNQSIIDSSAQGLANLTGEIVTTMDGIFIPAAQQAATVLAAQTAAQTNATAATTANTTATTTNTTATAASTTATITQTQAQTNLAAAVTQYQTDLASGSATAQQLTLDLANVGSAEQGLTTTATQTMQALTQATTATDAATNSLAILSPTVDVAGFTLSDAVQATVQPLAAAASSAETLSQAEAGATQTVDEGTNALGVMTTGIQSSTNGLWTFVQSLNGVVQSMSDATANLGDLSNVAATVVAPLTSVQQAMQQLNADLAAYNAGGGSLATVRADQAALQTAQLATDSTIENLGNLATAAQTVVAPLTSVQQAMNQLNSDLASFGTNLRANLTPTQTSTIESDQAALQTAQLATLPTTSMVPGSASWQYVNPNPDLMSAPTGNGPDIYPYGSTSTGVNLVVNVTGNSVTSAALVDQLANKVSSVIVTNLRTNAGLKN